MNKRVWSSVFLLTALIILTLPYLNITGAVVGESSLSHNIFYLLSLAFFLVSVFLFLTRKSLDAIVIPTGTPEADIFRTQKALSEGGELKKEGYYVISGYKGGNKEEIRHGQVYRIYNFLRNHGIKPSKMVLEGKAHDTAENVLYTLKKMKEVEEKKGVKRPWNIAFVSSPAHLKRFEDYYDEILKRGMVDKNDFIFHKIQTRGEGEEPGYEKSLPIKLVHAYKLKTIERYKSKDGEIKYNEKPDFFVSIINALKTLRRKIKGIK